MFMEPCLGLTSHSAVPYVTLEKHLHALVSVPLTRKQNQQDSPHDYSITDDL